MTEPQEIPALLFGPSWTTVDRSMSVLQHMWASTNSVISADEVSKEDMLFAAEVVAKSLANLPSSTRNLVKAHYLHNSSLFRNNNGEPIFYEDLTVQEELLLALGFQPTDLEDFYDLKKMARGRQLAVKEAANTVTSMYAKIAAGDSRDHQRYEFATRSVLSSFDNPRDQTEIMNQVRRKLELGRDDRAKLIMDSLKNIESEFSNSTSAFLPSVQKQLNRED